MLRCITPWLAQEEVKGSLQGMVQMLVTQTSLERVQTVMQQGGVPIELAEWLTQAEVTKKLGTEATAPGIFFPNGGWLNPPSVVKRCLQHPNITVKVNQSVTRIVTKRRGGRKKSPPPMAGYNAGC